MRIPALTTSMYTKKKVNRLKRWKTSIPAVHVSIHALSESILADSCAFTLQLIIFHILLAVKQALETQELSQEEIDRGVQPDQVWVDTPLSCTALQTAEGYNLQDEDPAIYSDGDSPDIFQPRREWPDKPLKTATSPISTATIETMLKVHHTQVDVLKSLGIDACRRYKEQQAESVLARVRTGMKICSICHVNFYSTQKLKAHIAKRHVQHTKHECPTCHKTYGDSQVLKIHMRSHNPAERRFECDQCDKKYTSVGKLNEHKKKVHEGVDAGPFTCATCAKVFAHRQNLKAHEPNCSQKSDRGEAQHECIFCGKRYRYKRDLTRHQVKEKH